MADGAAAEIILAQLVDADGGHDPCEVPLPLQLVLKRQGVDDGAEHADVIGGHPIHAAFRQRGTAENIPGADDHRHLHADGPKLPYFGGDGFQRLGIDSVLGVPQQGLAAQLEQYAAVFRPGVFH